MISPKTNTNIKLNIYFAGLGHGHFQGGIQRRKIDFQDALLSNSLYCIAQTQTDKSIIVSLSCLGNLKKWFSMRRFQLLADEQTPSLNAIFNIGMQCFVCECAKSADCCLEFKFHIGTRSANLCIVALLGITPR